MSNVLFWVFLHTPLTIIERHPHLIEDFPSPDKDIPVGVDATINEGWQDLKVKNNTNQTFKINPNDVYVIVENKEDKTVEITNKHKMNIIYRKDLTKKRKGYALDDAIKEILKQNKKYEAYFIFDADNILDKEYIKEMTKNIKEGYDIGIS